MINGCNENDLKTMRLVRDPTKYNYLKDSSCNNYMKSNDKSDYDTVVRAMSVLGFNAKESQTIWGIVAGVLHLVRIHAIQRIFKNFFFKSVNSDIIGC